MGKQFNEHEPLKYVMVTKWPVGNAPLAASSVENYFIRSWHVF